MLVNRYTILANSSHLQSTARVLLLIGAFCLFGCLAMLLRTGMAEGNGEPIPDQPAPDVLTRIGREIARSERERVPLYSRSWQVLLAIGLALIATAAWAFLAAVLGPLVSVPVVLVGLWALFVLYVRATQKVKTVQTPAGEGYHVIMIPSGVPVVSLRNRGKSWIHSPGHVLTHLHYYYGEWSVSVTAAGGQEAGTSEFQRGALTPCGCRSSVPGAGGRDQAWPDSFRLHRVLRRSSWRGVATRPR